MRSRLIRFASAIAVSSLAGTGLAVVTAGPSLATTSGLQPAALVLDSDCSPYDSTTTAGPDPHRCVPRAWGPPHDFGASVETGPGPEGAPTAYEVAGRASASSTAMHHVDHATATVTYEWDLSMIRGSTARVSAQRGAATAYTALELHARHSTCATCVVSSRRVLAGSETPMTGTNSWSYGEMSLAASLVLVNLAGGDVPPGDVRVVTDVESVVDWDLDATGVFAGTASAAGRVIIQTLTATPSDGPDITAPDAPTITGPSSGAPVRGDLVVSGQAEPLSTVRLSDGSTDIGTGTAEGNGFWWIPVTLATGSHTIVARATDDAGNTSAPSEPHTLEVDADAPAPPAVDTPVEGATTRGAVSFAGSAEPYTVVTLHTTGGQELATTSSDGTGRWGRTVTLPSGEHSVTATATDAVGNRSEASPARTFTVDAIAPIVVVTTYTPIDAGRARARGNASDNSAVTSITVVFRAPTGAVAYQRELVCAPACPSPSVTWVVDETQVPRGTYTVEIIARDEAGNTGAGQVRITTL